MNLKELKIEAVSVKEGMSNVGTRETKWVKYGLLSNKVWYGCFQKDYEAICLFNGVSEIKKDMTIKAVVSQTNAKDGKVYLNVNVPSVQEQISELALRIKKLEDRTVNKITLDEKQNLTVDFQEPDLEF